MSQQDAIRTGFASSVGAGRDSSGEAVDGTDSVTAGPAGLGTDAVDQLRVDQLRFDFLPDLPVDVQRVEGQSSSDAGLLPIRQADERLGYTRAMAACLSDARREPEHTAIEMLRQRLYGVLADYEDCNDHDALRGDPIFKMLAERKPNDPSLASQPTLSRFENAVDIPALLRILDFLCESGARRLRERNGGSLPPRVVFDLDATDDPAHGRQQLVLFHGYYNQHQYLPLIISEPTTQHVFCAWLRPGAVHAAAGADEEIVRIGQRLRAERGDIALHFRGDAGYGVPWMYQACEAQGYTYTFGLSSNKRLAALAQPLLDRAIEGYKNSGVKQRLFTHFTYRAGSWDRDRMVVAKAECQAAGTNLRFVITNLPVASDADARQIYDDYVQRGASEQRMDELKNGLHADRLSCHRFLANFWRLLLHTAALNLLNWVRDDAAIPDELRDGSSIPAELRKARPQTWRSKLIKVAATVVQTTRRLRVQVSSQWPHWGHYVAVSLRALNMRSPPEPAITRMPVVAGMPAGP